MSWNTLEFEDRFIPGSAAADFFGSIGFAIDPEPALPIELAAA